MEALDISSLVKTKAEARDLSVRLAAVSSEIFQTTFQLEAELSQQLGLQKKEQLLSLMRKQQIMLEKPSQVKDFLTKLQEQLNSLPVLNLTLAIEPTEKTLKILSEWFILNLKKQVLFDISVDPKLVAGIAIHYKGKFLDYSIRTKCDSVITTFLNQPQSTIQTLQQQTRQSSLPIRNKSVIPHIAVIQ